MKKTIYFVAGMPRSGSTLFMNLLNQNPRFYGTASSGLIEMVKAVRDAWDKNHFCRAMPEPERTDRKIHTLQGLMDGYFSSVSAPVCFDKNRGWPSVFELLSRILGGRNKIKAILCVRDVRDVLASFEKLYRRTSEVSSIHQERAHPTAFRSALGRAQVMAGPKEAVGASRAVIIDAIARGWRSNLFFLDYHLLTHQPDHTMTQVYEFLGEAPFNHDFNNVKEVTREDDSIHGFVGLHKIRSKIEPQGSQWDKIFGPYVTSSPFWKDVSREAAFWTQL